MNITIFLAKLKIVSLLLLIANISSPALAIDPGDRIQFDGAPSARAFTAIRNGQGLRLLWWNIHLGSNNLNESKIIFRDNFRTLISSNFAPDIIALAAYNQEAVGVTIEQRLRQLYPYFEAFRYPQSADTGVVIYSKYPLTTESTDAMDCGGDLACSRTLPIVKAHLPASTVTLIPVHLFDSWRIFSKTHRPVRTATEVIGGTANPVWTQIQSFRRIIEERVGTLFNEKNLVVMGDFNTMKPSKGYAKIAWGLRDTLTGLAPTFPAVGCFDRKRIPLPIRIDHVFVSRPTPVVASEVLQIKGSDHYPIYTIIKAE